MADALSILSTLRGHSDTIYSVAISPDGKMAATASLDRAVIIWDLASGNVLKKIEGQQGHNGQVLTVAFSPQGDFLASGGADNQARLWDVPMPWLDPLAGTVGTIPLVREAARQAANKGPRSFGHALMVNSVAFDPSGKFLATGCHDGNLRIWEVAKGQNTKAITAHVQTQPQQVQHPIYAVAWMPDGKQVLSASFDRSMKLWDVASGNLVREFKAAPDPSPIEKPLEKKEEPDKKDAKPPEKKDAKPPEKKEAKAPEPKKDDGPPGPPGHRDQVFAAVVSKDGKTIATCSSDRTVKLWDAAKGKVIREFAAPDLTAGFPGEAAPSHPGWVHAIAFTPDEKKLVSVGAAPMNRGHLAVWSVADGKRLAAVESEFPLYSVAVTSDGKRLLLGCGPKDRRQSEADVVLVKFPEK